MPADVTAPPEHRSSEGDETSAGVDGPLVISSTDADSVLVVLAPVLVVTALFLIATSSYEIALLLASPRWGQIRWRFVTLGSATSYCTPLVIACSLLTVVVAQMARGIVTHLWVAATMIAAIGFFVLIPIHLLDALQIEPTLPDAMAGKPMMLAVGKQAIMCLGAAAVTLTCSITTRRIHQRGPEQSNGNVAVRVE